MNYFPQNMNTNSNYFGSYTPTYPQPSYPQPSQNSGLIWVQGEAGAKSYLVAPNSTVMLMDSEGSRFYIKSTDGSGMPTLKTYVYHQEGATAAPMASNSPDKEEMVDFIKRDEFSALTAKIEELEKRVAEEAKKAERLAKIKKAVADDE